MKTINCYCENTFEAKILDLYDIDKDKKIIDTIVNGTFMSVTCPKCNKLLKPEYETVIKSKKLKIDLHFLPELERESYFMAPKEIKNKQLVIGYTELLERFKLIKSNLDHRYIEIIKLQLLTKAPKNADLKIYFDSIIEEKIVLHIHGLKENEIGISNIPMSVYKKIEEDFSTIKEEELYKFLLSGPYVSVRKFGREE